jgi:hypothetical protein
MSTHTEEVTVRGPLARAQNSSDGAQLDTAHIGDIRGALGTINQGDTAPRSGWPARLRTLPAILGPGLIVMAGDNDAGAFSTYSQAGQNYGNTLLWTLVLLIPVLYVNQEMVIRLGAVTGVGHARLILERFGKFWGAFSVIDLFLLNALTIISEFIGINLGLQYLGLPKIGGVLLAVGIVIAAASTGSFRRFERFAMCLVLAGVLLPSATVFLLLLCNDKAVLGPWVNGRWINLFTGVVIAIMVMLSIVLTASVLYPAITGEQILTFLLVGSGIALLAVLVGASVKRRHGLPAAETIDGSQRGTWRMPPLDQLPAGGLTPIKRVWMGVLRAYLLIAGGLVLVKIARLISLGH